MRLPAKLALTIPKEVQTIAERVEDAGAELWVVGGAVRDHVLGEGVDDWDLATSMRPEALQILFPDAVDVDPRYGRVSFGHKPTEIVITTFREEGEYHDHRHPSSIRFVDSLAADARRRDFTINAIYLHVLTGRLEDPCGGWQDLTERRLRVIGDSRVRMREDPIRMLRAIKFAVALDLAMDPGTSEALRSQGAMLASLSPERLSVELQAMFTGPGRGSALQLLLVSGLLQHCLPELVELGRERLELAARVLAGLPERSPALSWAGLLHGLASSDEVVAALRRMATPRQMRHETVEICWAYARVEAGDWPAGLRWPLAHRVFLRARLAALGRQDSLEEIEVVLDRAQRLDGLVDGRDLLALGVPAGPMLGELLAQLSKSFAGEASPDREQALARLRKLVAAVIKAVPQRADKERRGR